MHILHHLKNCKEETAVALGCFDGVHVGHMEVLKRTKETGLVPCVFTFDSNPKNYLLKEKTPQLCSLDQKSKIFDKVGLKVVFYIQFKTISNLEPERFVDEILIKKLHAKKIICGFNYHFGKGGKATALELKRICKKFFINVEIIAPIKVEGETISSTKIRNLIQRGEIILANKNLGRSFCYEAKVFKCQTKKDHSKSILLYQRYPESIVVPKMGIYSSIICFNNIQLSGITEISINNDTIMSVTSILAYTNLKVLNQNLRISLVNFIESKQKVK